MIYYTVCPDCGYKLLKAGDGSTIEIHCPKCGAKTSDPSYFCHMCGTRLLYGGEENEEKIAECN